MQFLLWIVNLKRKDQSSTSSTLFWRTPANRYHFAAQNVPANMPMSSVSKTPELITRRPAGSWSWPVLVVSRCQNKRRKAWNLQFSSQTYFASLLKNKAPVVIHNLIYTVLNVRISLPKFILKLLWKTSQKSWVHFKVLDHIGNSEMFPKNLVAKLAGDWMVSDSLQHLQHLPIICQWIWGLDLWLKQDWNTWAHNF